MEVEEESKNMASERAFTRDHRPRLLYITGTSFVTIAHKAFRRAEEFNGPFGALARTAASLLSPIINPLEHQCLCILSSIDDRILATEDIAVQVFPPSMHLFIKIDKLATLLNSLPDKFDQVFDQFIMLIHQLPLVDWTLEQSILALQFLISSSEKLISKLQFSASSAVSYNPNHEREIMVDINCDEQYNEVNMEQSYEGHESKKPNEEDDEDARCAQKVEEDIKEVENTCNEILAALEKMERVEEDTGGDNRAHSPPPPPPPPRVKWFFGNRMKKAQKHAKDSVEVKEDPILDLFDEGWLKR
ncbi:hypothetical protein J5N97_022182 [Dioscorea zingiberensis]|uniref:Uncharacterized protein n=1 Tax=Dioscorea zingiberensis TaxID=325984 RepID=A0A9D5CAQ5_9LILI|nr:hypothetical protein J5N97_022182 [Dioscorea zingiberensis]